MKILTDSSPHKSSFRSLSRLSFEDSYDDSEFSCPFVVDDDDIIDPGSRYANIRLDPVSCVVLRYCVDLLTCYILVAFGRSVYQF